MGREFFRALPRLPRITIRVMSNSPKLLNENAKVVNAFKLCPLTISSKTAMAEAV
jgi:hypothetical protein